MLNVSIPGLPVPQGSPEIGRTGPLCRSCGRRPNAKILNPSDLKAWREVMRVEMLSAKNRQRWTVPMKGRAIPVAVHLWFYFPLVGRAEQGDAKCTKPDIDKLTRAALDSCQDAGIIREDSRVSDLLVHKRYAHVPFMRVQVMSMSEWHLLGDI